MKTSKPSIDKLEEIANLHLNTPASQVPDIKVQFYDMQKIVQYLKGPEILEMGYGDGMWTKKTIELFGHTSILDASRKLLDKVKSKYGGKVACYESYFEDFITPDDKKFDTVIATHVFEHIYDPVHVLKQAKKWLAENGRMIIIVPNAESLHRELAVIMGIQKSIYDFSETDHKVGHVRVYDLKMLKEHVKAAAYKILYERGLFLKTLPNSAMTGFSDDLIKAMVDISDRLPANLMANLALVVEPE